MADAPTPPSGHPPRVLVVDDHRLVASSLAEALGQRGLEVVGVAGSVGESLTLVDARRPEVVLMDYRLPDGDGVAATATIKERYPEAKVIMVTSFADDQILVRAIEAGCSGFVPKNADIEEVVRAIEAAQVGEAVVPPPMLGRLLDRMQRRTAAPGGQLTPRELEILSLLAEGLSNEQIAERLILSVHTVRNQVQSVLRKLDVHSKLEAVAEGVRRGMISRG